jgi:hypothetical protein
MVVMVMMMMRPPDVMVVVVMVTIITVVVMMVVMMVILRKFHITAGRIPGRCWASGCISRPEHGQRVRNWVEQFRV